MNSVSANAIDTLILDGICANDDILVMLLEMLPKTSIGQQVARDLLRRYRRFHRTTS